MSFNKSNHKHCSCRHLLSAVSFAPVTSTFTNAISKSFVLDSIKKSLLSIALSSVLMSIALSACSSDGKPLKIKSGVDDPVSIEVKGVQSEEVEQNINAYLATLPTISKSRARLYSREITDKITTAMHSFGYYHPTVTLDFPKKESLFDRSLKANVDLGKPLFIRNCHIEVIGEGAYYSSFAKIIDESGLKSYTLLRHGNYEKLKEALKRRALEIGFFDAKIISSRILVYKEQNVADIQLVFDTGKRYQFGAVIADAKTKELMQPSLSLQNFVEGEYFSSKKLSDYTSALSQTNFYKSVDVRPLVEEKKDGKIPVSVALERQSKNLFRVGLGYSTDESVRGILAWDKPLINSKGHSFSSYFRVSSIKQDAQAIYKIPHKNPNLDYFYIKLAQTHTDFNDTLSDLSHASFHYVANMTGVWRRDYYLALEYEDFIQGLEKDKALNLTPGVILSRRTTTGGLDPKTGYSISFDNRFGTKAVTDANFFRSELVIKGVFSPTERTRVLYKLMQGGIFGSDANKVPPSMRFFVGGEQTLRGFGYKTQSSRRLGYLTGSRYLTAGTLEYMFPVGIENSRGAVFLDSAICTNSYSKDKSVLYGPGIGFRYMSKYGTFKVDLAYGIDNKNDNRQFKLHLSFGPEF